MATVDRTRSREGRGHDASLWTAHEVAAMLGVSHEYIWQLSREGRIPTVSLGRSRRYRPESVLSWLEEIESPGGRA
jgi:excisionase family DNA binding protein